MNRYFSSLFSTVLVFMSSLSGVIVYAAPGDPLSISAVKVLDNQNIRVTFSEAIDSESVVLKIMKQSDNSTVKTDSIKAVADTPETIDVALDDELSEASSYTLTVVAAIGKSGATIVDGATALQDFVTPSPLKIAGEAILNAPSNPNAVMSENTTNTPATTPTTTSVNQNPEDPIEDEPAPTEELPLTGPSTYFFLAIALITSYLLLRRSRA